MKKILFLFTAGLFLAAVNSGCSSVEPEITYDVLPALPEYSKPAEEFDTSAWIEFRGDSNEELNKVFLKLLNEHGYKNILPELRYDAHDLSRTWVVALLHLQRYKYKCADGSYLDTRVIVIIRKPGMVSGRVLNYGKARYFQAYSRRKLASDYESDMDLQEGYYAAMVNLFSITEFRQALEPAGKR